MRLLRRRGLEKGQSMSVSDVGVRSRTVTYRDTSALGAPIVATGYSERLELPS